MSAVKKVASLAFLVAAVAVGLGTTLYLDFDSGRVMTYFLIPFYVVTALMQYVTPFQPNDFGRREVFTDTVSNVGAVLMGAAQTSLTVALAAYAVPNLLVEHGIVAREHTLAALPIVVQIVLLFAISDFFYYWAHRLCHEVPFLWRFHSVHHSAHRISVLNASRVHPGDLVFRRIIPMLITLQLTGASPTAVLITGVIGSVLGTITHMNVDFDFGPVNLFIGTNQVHRWHHSTVYDEAKNFGLTMAWDHLFGTYFFPKDRKRPERFGLGDDRFFPLESYFGMLLVPFRWSALEAKQRAASPLPPVLVEDPRPSGEIPAAALNVSSPQEALKSA
jgi:sterol desaturase/sphingolipid hydroxylase (fatty acid hydroxylase superfamily)